MKSGLLVVKNHNAIIDYIPESVISVDGWNPLLKRMGFKLSKNALEQLCSRSHQSEDVGHQDAISFDSSDLVDIKTITRPVDQIFSSCRSFNRGIIQVSRQLKVQYDRRISLLGKHREVTLANQLTYKMSKSNRLELVSNQQIVYENYKKIYNQNNYHRSNTFYDVEGFRNYAKYASIIEEVLACYPLCGATD